VTPAGDVPAPDPAAARRTLRDLLGSGRLSRFPGAFTPLSARLIQEYDFEGVYVSGAVMSAELGLPDIGLTTATEVAQRCGQIASATGLPTLVDADTGWGEPLNVARTIQLLEAAGAGGCHLEDQENPKRCGHLDGKHLVDVATMTRRLSAAIGARRDPNLVICARTDARSVEGLSAAIDRARAYVDAGADMVFPEALTDAREFEEFRAAIDVPVMANMTEFGKSELLSTSVLTDIGIDLVIYPVTLLRLAMGAVEDGLRELAGAGSQVGVVPRMQTRRRLYDLLRYSEYTDFDRTIAELTSREDG
jgi:methylisocitrate lyase